MNLYQQLERSSATEQIYDKTCFGKTFEPITASDVQAGIDRAIKIDSRPAFLEGLCRRLNELGIVCTVNDTALMLNEVKLRFKNLLRKNCPKAVQNWIRGVTPGFTNRLNNFDLCFALEMDFQQTEVFFQKCFLTIPFNCKSRIDVVFLYCLYHKKPYSVAAKMLADSKGFVPQENAHTATAQILSAIVECDDDEKFLQYLSSHCYGNKQQFQLARGKICSEVAIIKEHILSEDYEGTLTSDRLNSLTIAALIGSKYQSKDKKLSIKKLPKRFTESLPNDVTLGRIINGGEASYELLRKTLMLLKFYNFYYYAENTDENTTIQNLLDFYDELNKELIQCGFAQFYEMHPFDCLLLYCANLYDPILAFRLVNEQ